MQTQTEKSYGKSGKIGALAAKIKTSPFLSALARQAAAGALGFLLSRIGVLGGYAPFGVAFLASQSGKRGMTAAFLGCLAGYASSHSAVSGVKYIASVSMIYLVTLVLGRVLETDSPLYSAAAAAAGGGAVSLIYTLTGGASAEAMLFFTAELLLFVLGALIFRTATESDSRMFSEETKEKRMLCVFSLLSLAAAALPSLKLGPVTLSPGLMAGMAFILLAAYESGIYGGVVSGLMIGLCADLAGAGEPVYTAALGLSGLLAGVFRQKNKLIFLCVFFVCASTVLIFLPGEPGNPGRLFDAVFACFLFALFPNGTARRIGELFDTGGRGDIYGKRVRKYLKAQLSGIAAAYEELAETVTPRERRAKPEKKLTGEVNVFKGAYDTYCLACDRRLICWAAGSEENVRAVQKTAELINARGNARKEDFAATRIKDCPRLDMFAAQVNFSIFRERTVNRYKSELDESRRLLSLQYSQLAEALDFSAAAAEENLKFDGVLEEKLRSFLNSAEIECDVLSYTDKGGRLHVELCGDRLFFPAGEVGELTKILSGIAGCSLGKPDQMSGRGFFCLSFTEEATHTCFIGAAAEKREENGISGDCGTYFKGRNGCMYIVLCDGMGSGKRAQTEAKNSVKLIESFLKAGLSPEQTADIVTSALVFGSGETSFATVDIAEINMNSGRLSLVKCGAAPTFVRRRRKDGGFDILELWKDGGDEQNGEGGVKTLLKPQRIDCALRSGDMILMVSDGVYSRGDREFYIQDFLSKLNSDNPREVAELVLSLSKGVSAEDDKTVIAVSYRKN